MSQQSYKQRAVENQGQFRLVEEKCIPKKKAALGLDLDGWVENLDSQWRSRRVRVTDWWQSATPLCLSIDIPTKVGYWVSGMLDKYNARVSTEGSGSWDVGSPSSPIQLRSSIYLAWRWIPLTLEWFHRRTWEIIKSFTAEEIALSCLQH